MHCKSKYLDNKPWQPVDSGIRESEVAGIYMLGEHVDGIVEPLYLGRSDNIRRRLKQHSRKSSPFHDKYKDEYQTSLDATNIRVKWIEEPNHKELEGLYLNETLPRVHRRQLLSVSLCFGFLFV